MSYVRREVLVNGDMIHPRHLPVEPDPFELVPAEAVADIADTSAADAEEVGDKLNELLASLRAAGFLAV